MTETPGEFKERIRKLNTEWKTQCEHKWINDDVNRFLCKNCGVKGSYVNQLDKILPHIPNMQECNHKHVKIEENGVRSCINCGWILAKYEGSNNTLEW